MSNLYTQRTVILPLRNHQLLIAPLPRMGPQEPCPSHVETLTVLDLYKFCIDAMSLSVQQLCCVQKSPCHSSPLPILSAPLPQCSLDGEMDQDDLFIADHSQLLILGALTRCESVQFDCMTI